MGTPWHAKFRQLCEEISSHVRLHPVRLVTPKGPRHLPHGWVEPDRPSGPTPALPEGWHEPHVNDQLPRCQ